MSELKESLLYLKIPELRALCERFSLPSAGGKAALIARIVAFVETGDIVPVPEISQVSKAQRGVQYPLLPQTLMLYGAYKNDARARTFFKQLIGEHFHFTAYGIDWLNERWLAGKPPTYAEFAAFWQQEHAARQRTKVAPKQEWAYINFTQRFLQENPTASRDEIIVAWEKERSQQMRKVENLLSLLMNNKPGAKNI